jgi:broad specificity phosphatase PhoE
VPGAARRKRVILVRHAATVTSEENRLPGDKDEPCSPLGEVQAVKVGEFLMDSVIDSLMASPAERAVVTASQIAKCQSLTGDRAPRLQMLDELADIAVGAFSGREASEARPCAACAPARRLSLAATLSMSRPANSVLPRARDQGARLSDACACGNASTSCASW